MKNINAVNDAIFRDKAVFVGARLFTKFAGERKDEYRNPYAYRSPDQPFMSGAEVRRKALFSCRPALHAHPRDVVQYDRTRR